MQDRPAQRLQHDAGGASLGVSPSGSVIKASGPRERGELRAVRRIAEQGKQRIREASGVLSLCTNSGMAFSPRIRFGSTMEGP